MLPADPQIEHIQAKWDELMAKDSSKSNDIDVCGCLLPSSTDVHAGPNSRRFIVRPVDHWNKYHKKDKKADTTTATSSRASSTLKRAADTGAVEVVVPAKKNAFIPHTSKTYKQCTKKGTMAAGKKVSVTVKSGSWASLDVASLIDPTVSLFKVGYTK